MTNFKPGDKVRGSVDQFYYREDADWTAEILSGPHDMAGIGGDVYLVKYTGGGAVDTGKTDTVHSRFLVAESAEPPTDPRVDVAAKALYDHRYPGRDGGDKEHRLVVYRSEARAVLAALGETLTTPDRTLRTGDKLRITKDRPHFTGLTAGDIVTVIRAEPDSDDDIRVRDVFGQLWYMPATGDDKGWEHV